MREQKNHHSHILRTLFVGFLLLMLPAVLWAQGNLQKKVTLNMRNVAAVTMLNSIKQQTGLNIVYTTELSRAWLKVTLSAKGETAKTVLDRLMTQLGCAYRLNGNIVAIYKPQPSGHKRQVSGIVKDESGEPLMGVPVCIGESKVCAITDVDGHYTLEIPTTATELKFSYVGMRTMYTTIAAGTTATRRNITLLADNQLADVVVTGYQTISRERAAGAYSILTEDDLKGRHTTDLSKALDGLVAGIQSTDNGRGGKKFTIRGTGTLMADNAPLIVVDGFPITDNNSNSYNAQTNPNMSALERINPDDIANITVLKDAAAASIWGARSANGVIVITTKKAKKGQPWQVEASTQLTVGQKQDVGYLTNYGTSKQTIDYQRWCFENGMVGDPYNGNISEMSATISPSLLLMYKYYNLQSITEDEMNQGLTRLSALDNREQIKKYLLRRPLESTTSASISGAVGNWTTRASAEYLYDKGDFLGSQDNRWKLNWDNNYRFNKYVAINLGLNLTQQNRHNSQIGLSNLTDLSPYEMLLNDDGSYATNFYVYRNADVLQMYDLSQFPSHDLSYNLLQEARQRSARTTNTQFRLQAGLELDLMEGLQFNSRFQLENSNVHQHRVNSAESSATRFDLDYYTPGDGLGNATGACPLPVGDVVMTGKGRNHSLLFRNDLTFNRTFAEKHAIAALLGNEVSNYWLNYHSNPYRYGVTASSAGIVAPFGTVTTMDGHDGTINGAAAEGKRYLSETWNHNRFVSFYGNVSYMYDERYGLLLSARSDASNLITSKAKYRWSPLWSVGAMWNLHNEAWLKRNNWVDRLSLRMTYGKNGNAASNSSARSTINTNTELVDEFTGRYPGSIYDYGNPDLRWEKVATTNVGLDFDFLNGTLYGSIDYYDKRSRDVLGAIAMSSINGTSSAVANNAELTNHGVELTLGSNQNVGEFSFREVLTYAYNKNKVKKLYTEASTLSDFLNAQYIPGYPMSPVFRFTYGGLVDGIPTIVAKDGTKYAITDYSIYYMPWQDLLSYRGTTIAPHTASLTLSATYKNLTLSAYFNGRFGGKVSMPVFGYSYPDVYSGKTNVTRDISRLMDANGNVIANATGLLPLPTTNDAGDPIGVYDYSTWYISRLCFDMNLRSSDYIYCSEIDLNWTLPQTWLSKAGIKGVDVFGKVENVGLIWAANDEGYYPEYLPGSSKPRATFTIGTNIRF